MSEMTTITITKETVEELKKMGSKGETYDEILKRMLQVVKMAEEHIKKRGLKEGKEPTTSEIMGIVREFSEHHTRQFEKLRREVEELKKKVGK